MSHEIRTPMSAVIGYADMLLEPEQSPSERLNCINIIRRNAEHLLTVINDILDISKIEAGKMAVERIECQPRRIVSEVTSLMRVRAAEKSLSFSVAYDGPIPRTIQTDPTRLRQILINLISNAIKFTESGGVRIAVKLIAPVGAPLLQFEVIDSGIGMTEPQLQRIFEAFEQADSSTTRRFGGTGLGLAISRQLAKLLGGKLTGQSELGQGSRFILTVETGPLDSVPMLDHPHETGDEEPHPIPKELRLKGRVLLAEDGVDNQQLLSAYLRRAGCDVVLAENGRIACDKAAAASASGSDFDVILMDMQMPELDGYGAASLLRARGHQGVIIALTAHAMSEDRDKCLQSGCTDYLTKPISRRTLLAALARYLEPTALDIEPIRTSADDEDLRRLIPKFVDHLPALVGKLLDQLGREDLKQLSESVHQLKGTGGLYGFMPVSESAARAEKALR
jgi:CheY-like chemotaxis protein